MIDIKVAVAVGLVEGNILPAADGILDRSCMTSEL